MGGKFGPAADIIGVIKARYGPIYSRRGVDFGPAIRKDDEIGRAAALVDNEVGSALVILSKQRDGAWKTSDGLPARPPQASI
jgi:hypothetical protein